jgi:asparagine synthase (glutamine-hydrolysing)
MLGEAASIRLESEVPLGVFLSGGLDSSAVVAEIARAGVQPRTYSVGFRDERLDETRFARAVAERFDARHTELVADTDVRELFDLFTAHYDAPFADSSALATLAVARAASDHVTVVLTGDGGDELFGGYERYLRYRQAVRIRDRMGPLSGPAAIASRVAGKALRLGRIARGSAWVADPWTGYRDALFHHPASEVASLLDMGRGDAEAPLRRLDALREASGGGPLGLAWIDQMTYLPDDLLTKADRATMAFGLEARSPFLDHRLAEWAATLPESLLWDDAGGKRLLREAYAEVLPPEILTRPKMGFGVPLESWMRAELRPCIDSLLLDPHSPAWSVLSFAEGSRMVRRFLDGDASRTYRTWNLLAFAGWARDRLPT